MKCEGLSKDSDDVVCDVDDGPQRCETKEGVIEAFGACKELEDKPHWVSRDKRHEVRLFLP